VTEPPPPLQHPSPTEIAEFTHLIDQAIEQIRADGGGRSDAIYAVAVSDLEIVRGQAVRALREWPVLGLTRGLDEKGYGADFDPHRRQVHEIIAAVQDFHRAWRDRYARPAIRRP